CAAISKLFRITMCELHPSQCGAMKAVLHPNGLDHLPAIKAWIAQGEDAETTRRTLREKYSHLPDSELWRAATEVNVLLQIKNLSTHPCVAARLAAGEIKVFGWYYDIARGQVRQYDQSQDRFVELTSPTRGTQPPTFAKA
ncbi:MAG: carbonic anhydrase, partial [Pirellulaceae bacterium]